VHAVTDEMMRVSTPDDDHRDHRRATCVDALSVMPVMIQNLR